MLPVESAGASPATPSTTEPAGSREKHQGIHPARLRMLTNALCAQAEAAGEPIRRREARERVLQALTSGSADATWLMLGRFDPTAAAALQNIGRDSL